MANAYLYLSYALKDYCKNGFMSFSTLHLHLTYTVWYTEAVEPVIPKVAQQVWFTTAAASEH